MNKKTIIIGNPVAGGGAEEKIQKAASILRAVGHDVELKLTARKGDAETFAREASALPGSIVVAAGGDGTYNEVANGLLHSDTPLAILPLGTTSVLARELGIPLNIDKALDVVANGKIKTIHMGKIIFAAPSFHADATGGGQTTATRHFLLMAGIGYDGEAVYGVNEALKKRSGKMAYITSGLRSIVDYNPSPLIISAPVNVPEDTESGKFRLHHQHSSMSGNLLHSAGYTIVVSKAACYGGDLKITPDAQLTSPYLYVFIGHKRRRLDLIRYLTAIISGRSLSLEEISYFRTTKITIEGSSRIQLDGDYAGKTPAEITIARDALKLVVPNNYLG
ncbi:MAG TPA: diacylglycerol kinase family protein [Dissulfurispiraceae bacterium]|nr:diacylglycerol kinase family protein [Dissulfurispiraceae bacterium]